MVYPSKVAFPGFVMTAVGGGFCGVCKMQLVAVYNIDGTVNRGGKITEKITLIMSYQGHKKRVFAQALQLKEFFCMSPTM